MLIKKNIVAAIFKPMFIIVSVVQVKIHIHIYIYFSIFELILDENVGLIFLMRLTRSLCLSGRGIWF